MIAPRVLVPVKPLRFAKTRLALPIAQRQQIAHALVEHTLRTVSAALNPMDLLVVSADPRVRNLADRLGARAVGDPYGDLNRAIQHGLSSIPLGVPVLVLVSDPPRLSQSALAALLNEVENSDGPCFVPDIRGTGTAAVYLPSGWRLPTLFGTNSAFRFRAAGWTPVSNAPDEVRIDLDTVSDLETYGVPTSADRWQNAHSASLVPASPGDALATRML